MLSLTAAVILQVAAPTVTTFSVEATGFASSDGIALVAFFDRDGWGVPPDPENALCTVACPILGHRAYAEIEGLPHGSYVILVFHDADMNGRPGPGEEAVLSGSPFATGGTGPSFEELAVMNKALETSLCLSVQEEPVAAAPAEGCETGGTPTVLHSAVPLNQEPSCSFLY